MTGGTRADPQQIIKIDREPGIWAINLIPKVIFRLRLSRPTKRFAVIITAAAGAASLTP
jgi:hypothetical protein